MILTDDCNVPAWRVIGQTVQGASHKQTGRPNQDAISHWPVSGKGTALIVAVADGHGSAKCFRSHTGAKFAVTAAIEGLQWYLNEQPNYLPFLAFREKAEQCLTVDLFFRWEEMVGTHIHENPFTPEELEELENKVDPEARQEVENNPNLAYGATMLAVLLARSYGIYLQLGDGDILAVSDDGQVIRPLPGDERLVGNETTSLCRREPIRDFRIKVEDFSGPRPALVLLATDGYANSFVSEEDFLKVAPDFLGLIRQEGVDQVRDNLEAWLTETSRLGSGDDITLGLICRLDALGHPSEIKAPGEQVNPGMSTNTEQRNEPSTPENTL
jgi:serine/threonine protein phosphatase PrpC